MIAPRKIRSSGPTQPEHERKKKQVKLRFDLKTIKVMIKRALDLGLDRSEYMANLIASDVKGVKKPETNAITEIATINRELSLLLETPEPWNMGWVRRMGNVLDKLAEYAPGYEKAS